MGLVLHQPFVFGAMNGTEAAIKIASELVGAWNSHDVDRVAELFAEDYEGIDVAQASPQYGPEGVRQTATAFFTAFPDLNITLEETVVQGNRIALVWTARGAHLGKWSNIPPTGHYVAVRGVSFLSITDGRIVRGLYVWDFAGLLRALRLLPDL